MDRLRLVHAAGLAVTAAVEVFDALETLPPDCAELFAAGARHSFQLGRPWFATVLAEAMPAGARGLFLLCRTGQGPGVLFALRTLAGGAGLEGLSTLYSCLYQPLAAAQASPADLRAAGLAFGGFCLGWSTVRLDALDSGWPGLPPLLEGVRAAGLAVLRFDHFGNWHENVAGRSWADYLAARPGALRETIRRRGNKLRASGASFRVLRAGPGLAEAIRAYQQIYARSWKTPEPFPLFNPAFMRACAADGTLRLGLLTRGETPLAAQFWVVRGGCATVLKLAHDEQARAEAPGTVLTAHMIETLIEQDNISELDFGRGDDPYKADWTDTRRQRTGVLLADPWRPAGLAAIARHLVGVMRRGRK